MQLGTVAAVVSFVQAGVRCCFCGAGAFDDINGFVVPRPYLSILYWHARTHACMHAFVRTSVRAGAGVILQSSSMDGASWMGNKSRRRPGATPLLPLMVVYGGHCGNVSGCSCCRCSAAYRLKSLCTSSCCCCCCECTNSGVIGSIGRRDEASCGCCCGMEHDGCCSIGTLHGLGSQFCSRQ